MCTCVKMIYYYFQFCAIIKYNQMFATDAEFLLNGILLFRTGNINLSVICIRVVNFAGPFEWSHIMVRDVPTAVGTNYHLQPPLTHWLVLKYQYEWKCLVLLNAYTKHGTCLQGILGIVWALGICDTVHCEYHVSLQQYSLMRYCSTYHDTEGN